VIIARTFNGFDEWPVLSTRGANPQVALSSRNAGYWMPDQHQCADVDDHPDRHSARRYHRLPHRNDQVHVHEANMTINFKGKKLG
jgi:hypothetical protein